MNRSFYRTLTLFDVLFVLFVFALSFYVALPPLPSGLALVAILGLAAFRVGHAVSFNTIFLPLRLFLGIITTPDPSMGENNDVTGGGAKRASAELVSCPICSGTWAAAILVAVLVLPNFGTALIYILAGAGMAEFLHWFSEATQWTGRAARDLSGAYSRQNKSHDAAQPTITSKESDEWRKITFLEQV